MSRLITASIIILCGLVIRGTHAETLQQPISLTPATFDYQSMQLQAQPDLNSQAVIQPVSFGGACGCQTAACPAPAPVCQPACQPCGNSCGGGCGRSGCGLGGCLGAGGLTSCLGLGGAGSGIGGVGGFGIGSLVPGLPIAMQLLQSAAAGNCTCEPWTLSSCLYGDCEPCVSFGGWVQLGYHTESNDLFNNRPDQLNLHQGWLYAEKAATCQSPIGFRADLMYGIDGTDTQAFGNNPGVWDFDNGFDHGAYSWAIPQLYAEVLLGEFNVKIGHFYTLIGYEVVTAPDNFFYSHAMTMYNSEPFTHTGVLASRSFGDNVTVYGGWTAGWDTGFDQLGDGSSWLGGASVTLSENASFTYMSTAGDFGARGDQAYSHSIVLDTALTGNLNYVFQSDLLRVDGTGEDNVGINQYLLYNMHDCIGLGARFEWWKGDVLTGYAPHGGVLPVAGSLSYYAATFGANIKPSANLTVRPEVRMDWSPAANYDQTYFGVDGIFTF